MDGAEGRTLRARGAIRAAEMLARGLRHRPFMASGGGPLFVGRHVRLTGLRWITHEGRLVIEDGAEVQGESEQGLVFGREVSIGARTAIRPSSYYGGQPGRGLRMGDRSSFATGCFVGCSGLVDIGSDVMFGPGVQIHAENHRFDRVDVPIKTQGVERRDVTVEDDCWIGSNSIITAGVRIGRGSVVGAGSIVTSDLEPYSIAVGSPARRVRDRRADQLAEDPS